MKVPEPIAVEASHSDGDGFEWVVVCHIVKTTRRGDARLSFSLLGCARCRQVPKPTYSQWWLCAGQRPQKGWVVAASVCETIEALTRALAVELAPIRVNAVSPEVV